MPPAPHRTVFVANIPFEVSEEQLANTFSEVGPVQNVEIKFDPNTGRSKGYAFVQYHDEATAMSAVRNLKDVLVNGRNLRVELSTEDPGPRRRGGTGGPPRGDGGRSETPPRLPQGGLGGPPVDLQMIPPGQDIAPGEKATDVISRTLAAVSPGQMQDVMAGVKQLITSHPEQARQLLASQPQLAYALFQAMLLLKIVDPSVLQERITPVPSAAPPPGYPPAAQAPPSNFPPYPSAPQPNQGPTQSYRPPQQGYNAPPPAPAPQQPVYGGYQAPPPAAPQPPALPPQAQAALATLPEDQRTMLVQVLSLTPDQISALDAQQRASIMQLRQQFLGSAA